MPILNIRVKIAHGTLEEVLKKLGFKRYDRTVVITHNTKKGLYNKPQKIICYKHKKGQDELVMSHSPLYKAVSDTDYINVKNYLHYNNILDQDKFDKKFIKL